MDEDNFYEFRRKDSGDTLFLVFVTIVAIVFMGLILDFIYLNLMNETLFIASIVKGIRYLQFDLMTSAYKPTIIITLICLIEILILYKLYYFTLKQMFRRQYEFEDDLKNVKVKFNLFKQPNSYDLRNPHWQHPRKDGEADRRYKSNYVIFPKCVIFVDKYKVVTHDPVLAWDIVQFLRNKDVEIPLLPFEEWEYDQLKRQEKFENSSHSVNSLIKRFGKTPTDFEEYVCSIFRAQGWMAETTPRTNDGGYDFILKKPYDSEEIIAIGECKLYSEDNIVGRPLLQKLVGANVSIQAKHLLFVTTSSYSKEAILYADLAGIKLIDGNGLIELEKEVKPNQSNFKEEEHTIKDLYLEISDFGIPQSIMFKYYEDYLD